MIPSHRPSDRTRLCWLLPAVAMITAATAAGCVRRGAEPGRRAPVVLRIGFPMPGTHTRQGIGITTMLSFLTEEGLTRVGRDGHHEPHLAESWEVLDGGLTLRLRLRENVKFSDGTDLTAELCRASLERSRQSLLAQYPMLSEVRAIETDGARTLLLRLHRPSGFLLDDLEVPIDKPLGDGRAVTTGPFYVDSTSDDLTVLRSNTHYLTGSPMIDVIEVKTHPTARTAWASLMREEADLLYVVPNEAREFVEQESSVRVFSTLRPYVYTLLFNLRQPLFASSAVRSALNLAVDRDALVKDALGGRGVAAKGQIWPHHFAYSTDLPPYKRDPAAADILLTKAGFPPAPSVARPGRMLARLRFTCLISAGQAVTERLAIMIQQQLFDVGVDMQIEELPFEQFVGRVFAGQYDAAIVDISGGPPLVRPYQFWHAPGTGGMWDFGYRSADAALEAMRTARNDTELTQAARELQRVMHEDPPAIFLCWPETARAVSRRFVVPLPERDLLATIRRWTLAPPGLRRDAH